MITDEDRMRAIMVADKVKREASKVRQESTPRAADDTQAKQPWARWNSSLKARPTVETAMQVAGEHGVYAARDRWRAQTYDAVRRKRRKWIPSVTRYTR